MLTFRTSWAALFTILFLLPGTTYAAPKTDGCEFIRRALNRLPEKGGVVKIPPGTFTCKTPIVLDRNGVGIDGGGKATLRLADNSNAPLVIMGEVTTPPRAVYDLSVTNLTLDGNMDQQQMECWGGPCDSGGNAFVRNNGITVRGVVRGTVKNVIIHSARSGGIVTERHCQELNVTGLKSTNNFFDGFAGYQTYNSTFSHLDLSENKAAGISIDIDFSTNTFRNATLRHNKDVGIFMRGSNQNLFDNLVITESGNHGIFLAQADGEGSCSNFNEFLNLSVSGSKGAGFLLNNPCVGNRLTGTANFEKNGHGCIHVAPGANLEIPATLKCLE